MAGYSGSSLAHKLGITADRTLVAMGAPSNYLSLLAPLPSGVRIVRTPSATADLVHLFVTDRADLTRTLPRVMKRLRPPTPIWVSWPKQASKVRTDVTEQTIRDIALPLGLVDIKVCAVDEIWSGLKLVVRKERR